MADPNSSHPASTGARRRGRWQTPLFYLLLVALSVAALWPLAHRQQLADSARKAVADGDYAAAATAWRTLAEDGDTQAQFNLGVLYAVGQGVARDPLTASAWYRRAAAAGLARAQVNLALLLLDGDDLPGDTVEAARWLQLAADQGHPEGQNNLGNLYRLGLGVPRDIQRAIGWFERAAAAGNRVASLNLAQLLANGDGIARDPVAAFARARQAAEGEDATAAAGRRLAAALFAAMDTQTRQRAELRSASLLEGRVD